LFDTYILYYTPLLIYLLFFLLLFQSPWFYKRINTSKIKENPSIPFNQYLSLVT
jgi:hypothetical protein